MEWNALAMGLSGLFGGVTNLIGQGNAAEAQAAQIEYMKKMQAETWRREDNAVQRRVQDLRAAGLSPTLAAGSAAGTSAPIQIGAEKPVDPGAAVQAAIAAMQPILMKSQIAKTDADIDVARSQAQSIQYDTLTKEWNNKVRYMMLPDEWQQKLYDMEKTQVDTALAAANAGLAHRALKRDMRSDLRPGSIGSDLYDLSQRIGQIVKDAVIVPQPEPGQ